MLAELLFDVWAQVQLFASTSAAEGRSEGSTVIMDFTKSIASIEIEDHSSTGNSNSAVRFACISSSSEVP
jgi:hypothetical protein